MTIRITAVVGPMFSGKTEELLRRLNREKWAREAGGGSVSLVLKPAIDNRYGSGVIATKKLVNGESVLTDSYPATDVETLEEAQAAILALGNFQSLLLVIDEGQFLKWLPRFISWILKQYGDKDMDVVISGLDQDAERRPFGPMPDVLALADNVLKLTAVCFRCGGEAGHTKRMDNTSRAQVQIGDSDKYEARCRACHAEG